MEEEVQQPTQIQSNYLDQQIEREQLKRRAALLVLINLTASGLSLSLLFVHFVE